MQDHTFALRHSFEPYAFRGILFLVLCLWFGFFAVRTGEFMPLAVGVAILAYFAAKAYFYEARYSVSLVSDAILMHPAMLWYSPKYLTAITFSDITSVETETSDLRTVLAGVRPSRRVAIYADQKPPPNIIDVSLKHFNLDDIRLLLEHIKQARPDLSVPSL